MSSQPTAPTLRESHFRIEELFFSTTDARGKIASGNAVFERTAKYAREDMVGWPHNLGRHPDMPRAVFHLLWETIQEARPFAGYVKNMAQDGSYYWVMALVLPAGDGYLAVRPKPTTGLFASVQELHGRLRPVEQDVEATGERSIRAAARCVTAAARPRFGDLGFASYQDFMRHALVAEVAAREAAVGSSRQDAPRSSAAVDGLAAALDACDDLSGWLGDLVRDLDRYRAFNRVMGERSALLAELAGSTRVFALNATLAASRLGPDGVALGAVASLLRGNIDTLTGAIAHVALLVERTVGPFKGTVTKELLELDARLRAVSSQLDVVRALETNGGSRRRACATTEASPSFSSGSGNA